MVSKCGEWRLGVGEQKRVRAFEKIVVGRFEDEWCALHVYPLLVEEMADTRCAQVAGEIVMPCCTHRLVLVLKTVRNSIIGGRYDVAKAWTDVPCVEAFGHTGSLHTVA